MALESELAELRLAVRELCQTASSRALRTTSSNQDTTTSVPVIAEVSQERTEDQTVATCLDPPVAPVRVIRKMYTWINGNPETPKDVVELPESIRAQLASNDLGLRLIETFIDAWLLSGSLILHLMLSLDFPVRQQMPLSLRYTEDDRNRILMWNSACLQHLKFTIGVGKLSAVRMDLAAHYIGVVKHTEGFSELDKEVVAELELFILLYRGIVEEHISAKQLQSNLSQWHTTNAKLFDLDDSLELKFALSTFGLLANRWALSQHHKEDINNARENAVYDQHIEPILKHSHQIIRLSREMTRQKRVIHTFDFLMGAYAHVTLVEFSDHLEDIDKTFRLMEEVQNLRKDTYVVEPVSIWAMNMMRKRLLDTARPEMDVQTEMLPGLNVWWPPFEALSTRMEYTSTEVSERDQ
ncbi:hypothetical protein ACKRZS_006116 [Fusarium odoratissimum]